MDPWFHGCNVHSLVPWFRINHSRTNIFPFLSEQTSLVNIIATNCRGSTNKRFVKLSATTSGINDVKEAVKIAKNEAIMFKKETVLFIDEIHRFNKLQQVGTLCGIYHKY